MVPPLSTGVHTWVRHTAPAHIQRKNPGVTCNLGVVRRLQVTPVFFCSLAVGAVCGTQVKKNRVFWGHFGAFGAILAT